MFAGSLAAPDARAPRPLPRAALLGFAALLAALFVLNFALTFHNVWPTLWITTRHELSIEIAVLMLAMALYARGGAAVPGRALTALAGVLTVLTIGRYAEVTAPALYGRAVNLYWDAQYLPNVAAMLGEVANPLLVAALIGACVLLVCAIYLALRWSLGCVAANLADRRRRRLVGGLAGALVAVYALGHTSFPLRTLALYSLPVTHTYWQQARFIAAAAGGAATVRVPAGEPLGSFELPRLAGADVVVHFVESYGATAFDAPPVAAALAPSRAELAAALAATGRLAASAFVESPTFGGASWLAHSSFMTGLDIREGAVYDLLLTQKRTTLATRFAALGYRPVALMPGLRNEWPEGAFYGFSEIYGARMLDYRGPEFGWWRIPDQYALARLAELELELETRPPLFVFFPTISTHMPFRPVPPYQPDWTRLLSPEPFTAAQLAGRERLPDWMNLRPAYAETLVYTYSYLSGFFRAHGDRDLLWIVIGDHQPAASVSGPGARADVPVHVITRDAEVVSALLARGFTAGLTPKDAALGPMHALPGILLDALAAPGGGPRPRLD